MISRQKIMQIRRQMPIMERFICMNWGHSGPSPRPILRSMQEILKRETQLGPFHPKVTERRDTVFSHTRDVIAQVIGARQWQGGIADVPVMGNDDSDFTKGFIETGSTPQFKLLKNDELINLIGEVPAWSNNQIYMIGYLEESIALPAVYSLSTAYPNPFNPTTTLSFAIPIDSEVSLSIYNLQGRQVTTLISGNMEAGYHSIIWDADSHSSGVYFVKMIAGEYVGTQKLMLVK